MSLVEPSSEFRVEKYRSHAVITLTSGAAVMGHFFLAEASPTLPGRERVAELLNSESGFFPFENERGQTVLYNRDHIVSVEVSDDEAFAEDEEAETELDERDEQKNLYFRERETSPQTSRDIVAGKLSLHQLVELAEATAAPGETRLVAWTEQELPGLKIDPPAAQNRRLTLVVAHLDYGALEAPKKDAVAWLDVVSANDAHFADPNEGDDE